MGFLNKLFNRYLNDGHYGDQRYGKHGGGHHGQRDGGEYSNNAAGLTCQSCRTPNPPGAQYCRQCGVSLLAATCSACGTSMPPGTRYCGRCGAETEK